MVPVVDVKVGARHRKDFGDMPALAASMNEIGLLQPIGVNRDNELLWGRRRLKAAEILECDVIAAVVIDCDPNDKALIEYHENVCRKDFTISEMVEIGRDMEKAVGNRQGQRTDKENELVGICPQVEAGEKTRDVAAAVAGFGSADTYRRAKSVIGTDNQDLIALVDKGKISVAMGAQVAKLDADKQRQYVLTVLSGTSPAAAWKVVKPEDDALHVNVFVQEWIADGKLSGAAKDAVLNLGGASNPSREAKQSQYVRRVKEGLSHADALESVRKGGKRPACGLTEEERQEAKQRIGEAIGTLIVEFSRLGMIDEVHALTDQLSAKLKAA
jgi:ParB family chromosome partitioning protein